MPADSVNRLLIVDDDQDVADCTANIAASLGFTTRHVATAHGFDAAVAEFDPTVITLDLNLPDGDGVELLKRLADSDSQVRVLVISGVDRNTLQMIDKLAVAQRLHLLDVLPKPVAPEVLIDRLKTAWQMPSVGKSELVEALASGLLTVCYQPRVSLRAADWPIVGAEALLRWQHPGRGAVSPDDFVPVARQHGLMPMLTDYVLERAIEQLSSWRRSGLNLDLSVNFDPHLVDDFQFPDRLVALLREHDVPPQALILDLTEVANIEDPDMTASVLTRLRIQGIQLSLDNFGVGYSSLTQLRSLPFSEVKIARELIRDLADGSGSEVFVRAIVDLSKSLGLRVCAVGVETWEAVTVLRASDCDCAEGYLFGQASPPAQFQRLVAAWDGKALDGLRREAMTGELAYDSSGAESRAQLS